MNNYDEADKISLIKLKQLEKDLSTRLEKLTLDMSKSHSSDLIEQAIERENDEVISSLDAETKVELQQIKNAIKRIQVGNYHLCEKCGDDIPAERLSVIPYTTFCLECAVSQEA